MDRTPTPLVVDPQRLDRLARLLAEEIPLSVPMGVRIDRFDEAGLWVSMPLEPNRNPHQTAFAGSLNALCTLAGWAMTHLVVESLGLSGATVIRRSSIKYHEPVQSDRVVARCVLVDGNRLTHFAEMLAEKGQAKLDHGVQIDSEHSVKPAVLFGGSYVVHLESEGAKMAPK